MSDDSVVIRDVMLRDGLQNIPEFVPTAVKIGILERLMKSGVRDVEFTSFVNPKAVPQFQDAGELAREAAAKRPPDAALWALVPNLWGARAALENGVRRLVFVMSVSESHNLSNVRRTREESLEELKRILELRPAFLDFAVKTSFSTVFGCPFEGKLEPAATYRYLGRVFDLGIRDFSLADTVGFGNPRMIREICAESLRQFPEARFGIHLHNTRGLGLANSLAAFECGIRIHDGAVGGLGGCPFAPGATGNTATEDLVFMFAEMGVETGIDLGALFETAAFFQSHKKDVCYTGSLLRAGVPAPRGPFRKEGPAPARNV